MRMASAPRTASPAAARAEEGEALPRGGAEVGRDLLSVVRGGEGAAVVTGEGLERGDEEALAPRGAEARVELVARARRVRGADEADDPARRAREISVGIFARRGRGGIEEEEDVEVGAVADLAAAELAHRHHGEAARGLVLGGLEGEADRGVERGVGEGRERGRGLAGLDLAGEIGEADLDGDAGLGAAEGGDEPVLGIVVVVVAGLGGGLGLDRRAHLGAGLGRRGRALGEEERVAELGVVGERVADEGAGAEGLDEAAHRARIVAEELGVDAEVADAREEDAEVARGLLGIGGLEHGLDHRLAEARERLAAARAEERVGVARELEEIARGVGPAIGDGRPRRRALGQGSGGAGDHLLEGVRVAPLQRGEDRGEARRARGALGQERRKRAEMRAMCAAMSASKASGVANPSAREPGAGGELVGAGGGSGSRSRPGRRARRGGARCSRGRSPGLRDR